MNRPPFTPASRIGSTAPASGQPLGEPSSAASLTRVSIVFVEQRINLYLRFGRPQQEHRLDHRQRCAFFLPGACFARILWQANDFGTTRWQLLVLQACSPQDRMHRIPGIRPGARILLHVEGWLRSMQSKHLASIHVTFRLRTGARSAIVWPLACYHRSTRSSDILRGSLSGDCREPRYGFSGCAAAAGDQRLGITGLGVVREADAARDLQRLRQRPRGLVSHRAAKGAARWWLCARSLGGRAQDACRTARLSALAYPPAQADRRDGATSGVRPRRHRAH